MFSNMTCCFCFVQCCKQKCDKFHVTCISIIKADSQMYIFMAVAV